jgi:hypothetical protein
MAKLPAFAKAFAGRWRIVEMDVWDKDFLDLVETAHLTFKGAADGTRPPVVDGLSLALQAASSDTSTSTTATIQASYAIAPDFFNGLLSCSLSRGGAQFFTPPPRTAPIVGAHSRRQDPKTPVEQALMRGLGTA